MIRNIDLSHYLSTSVLNGWENPFGTVTSGPECWFECGWASCQSFYRPSTGHHRSCRQRFVNMGGNIGGGGVLYRCVHQILWHQFGEVPQGCDPQVSTNFWPYTVVYYFLSQLPSQYNPPTVHPLLSSEHNTRVISCLAQCDIFLFLNTPSPMA